MAVSAFFGLLFFSGEFFRQFVQEVFKVGVIMSAVDDAGYEDLFSQNGVDDPTFNLLNFHADSK